MLHSVGLSTGSIGVGGFSFSAFLIGVDCSSLSVSSSSLRIIYQLEHHIAYTCNTIESKTNLHSPLTPASSARPPSTSSSTRSSSSPSFTSLFSGRTVGVHILDRYCNSKPNKKHFRNKHYSAVKE